MPSYYGIYFVFCIIHVFQNGLIVDFVENTEYSSMHSVVSCLASFFPMIKVTVHSSLIRKRKPGKTSASELVESHQGFSVAIPVLQVKREIQIRKPLP